MKGKRILIPLDGSSMAEEAIAQASGIKPSDGSTIILIRAASVRSMPGLDVVAAQVAAVREAEEYLAAVKERLERDGTKTVETHVWYGIAAAAIVEAAEFHKADLIVMTTHGRSGLPRVIFGSVAESVLRSTTIPILLVRSDGAPIDTLPGRSDARLAGHRAVPRPEDV